MRSFAQALFLSLAACLAASCTASQDLGDRPGADGGSGATDGGVEGADGAAHGDAGDGAGALSDSSSGTGASDAAEHDGADAKSSTGDAGTFDDGGAGPDAADASLHDADSEPDAPPGDDGASDSAIEASSNGADGSADAESVDSTTADASDATVVVTDAGASDAGGDDGASAEDEGGDAAAVCAQACDAGTACVGGSCVSPVQGPCAAGALRCDPLSPGVDQCNDTGTAWLYAAACTTGCSSGLCTDTCTPGAARCRGNVVELCEADAGPATWAAAETCSTYCGGAGQCALDGLQVATPITLDGDVYVQGTVHVYTGGVINSPTGNLNIHADSIVVDEGGSIVVAPTGTTPTGQGAGGSDQTTQFCYAPGAGGSYGTTGVGDYFFAPAWGSSVDGAVAPGSAGGNGALGGAGGDGGGVLRLLAPSITIAGTVHADGLAGAEPDGGGGSGGGVLVAGDSVTISGTISATNGGAPTGNSANLCSTTCGGGGCAGGEGRVKVLWGSAHSISGTLTGVVTQGLLPPLQVTSVSAPDPTLVYNDGLANLFLGWDKPFPSSQGYFALLNTTASGPPTVAATFYAGESTWFAPSALVAGKNYFHIAPVDAASNVGTVETVFPIVINASPPQVSSSTHPDPMAWSTNTNPYFTWTFAQSTTSVSGAYYAFDHQGSTVPDATSTFLPVTQESLFIPNVAAGVWVFHLVSVDTMGNRTKAAAHYRVNIGADPGTGSLVGTVVDGSSNPVSGATISVNDGLYAQTTDSTGAYNISAVTAGTWQVTATSGSLVTSASVTVTASGVATANFTLE